MIMIVIRLEAERAEQRRLGEAADHEARLVGIFLVVIILFTIVIVPIVIILNSIIIIVIILLLIMTILNAIIAIIIVVIIIVTMLVNRCGRKQKLNKECGRRASLAR